MNTAATADRPRRSLGRHRASREEQKSPASGHDSFESKSEDEISDGGRYRRRHRSHKRSHSHRSGRELRKVSSKHSATKSRRSRRSHRSRKSRDQSESESDSDDLARLREVKSHLSRYTRRTHRTSQAGRSSAETPPDSASPRPPKSPSTQADGVVSRAKAVRPPRSPNSRAFSSQQPVLTSVRNPDSPRSHHMQRRATGSAQPDLVTETVPLPDEANTLSSDGASDPGEHHRRHIEQHGGAEAAARWRKVLFEAIRAGDIRQLRQCFESPDININDQFFALKGVGHRSDSVVQFDCYDYGAASLTKDDPARLLYPYTATCLHVAAFVGQPTSVQWLLDHHGDPSAQDGLSQTPADVCIDPQLKRLLREAASRTISSALGSHSTAEGARRPVSPLKSLSSGTQAAIATMKAIADTSAGPEQTAPMRLSRLERTIDHLLGVNVAAGDELQVRRGLRKGLLFDYLMGNRLIPGSLMELVLHHIKSAGCASSTAPSDATASHGPRGIPSTRRSKTFYAGSSRREKAPLKQHRSQADMVVEEVSSDDESRSKGDALRVAQPVTTAEALQRLDTAFQESMSKLGGSGTRSPTAAVVDTSVDAVYKDMRMMELRRVLRAFETRLNRVEDGSGGGQGTAHNSIALAARKPRESIVERAYRLAANHAEDIRLQEFGSPIIVLPEEVALPGTAIPVADGIQLVSLPGSDVHPDHFTPVLHSGRQSINAHPLSRPADQLMHPTLKAPLPAGELPEAPRLRAVDMLHRDIWMDGDAVDAQVQVVSGLAGVSGSVLVAQNKATSPKSPSGLANHHSAGGRHGAASDFEVHKQLFGRRTISREEALQESKRQTRLNKMFLKSPWLRANPHLGRDVPAASHQLALRFLALERRVLAQEQELQSFKRRQCCWQAAMALWTLVLFLICLLWIIHIEYRIFDW